MGDPRETSAVVAREGFVADGSRSAASSSPAPSPARDGVARERTLRDAWAAHRAGLFRLGLRYGGGRRAFAEDVVQETFLKLWDRIDVIADAHDVGGWLYRVCTNECLTRLRRESFRNSPVVTWLLGHAQPEPPSADVRARLDADRLDALDALRVLPPKERIAFCMVHLDGKTLREVGAVLGLTPGAVHKVLDRANGRLVAAGWQTPSSPRDEGGTR
jgi:RNA polymerase sigma-70 factor (ECF subfamily)